MFWSVKDCPISYSPFGAKLIKHERKGGKTITPISVDPELLEKQTELKNSPKYYHQAEFLSIGLDLIKLLDEGRVDRIVFLTAYDKKRFPDGDPRKIEMFRATFGDYSCCSLQLIGFDGKSKDKDGGLGRKAD